jgi:hypothetical protein
MAKKRKREKEVEGYEFKMPEFDEEEYVKKEVRESKALFVTFGYAALIGVISFGLTSFDLALGVLVGIIAVIFLRHIYPLIGVDTSALEKKTWAGNIIMYLFTWLAVWILLSNPPFSDSAEPTIENVEEYFGSPGNWTIHNETNVITQNTNVSINATIVDNVKVDENTIRVTVKRNDVEVDSGDMERIGKNRYAFVFYAGDQGLYEYTISVKDTNGREAKYSGNFYVEE